MRPRSRIAIESLARHDAREDEAISKISVNKRAVALSSGFSPFCSVFICEALCLLSSPLAAAADAKLEHPYLLVSAKPAAGLRSVEDVRRDIQHGRSAELWQAIVDKVNKETQEPVIVARQRNRTYSLVATTCNRIKDAALVALITGERRYADAALAQIEVLFDEREWPDWADKAHLNAGLNSDLRHGQFARAVGLAYDWIYPLLGPDERARIVAGVDRCAIQRFKASVAAEETWIRRQSNWKTSVVGGFAILGMALGDDHPDAEWLREFADPLMDKYMEVFGPQGEFNESPQYASSTCNVVDHYLAKYYMSGGQERPVQLEQLRDFSRWLLYCILPPDRMIAFGDGHTSGAPNVSYFCAVASALRDPVTQWMYLRYVEHSRSDTRRRAQELLYYDSTLKPQPPTGRLPLGRSFPAQAGIVTSRSSWDPERPISIVYSKARTEDVHRHDDWGQVCIDGFGQRLVVDLGSPPVYPRTDKQQYYNYQQCGHNVLVLGDDELDVTWWEWRQGRLVDAQFDDSRGGAWTFDLSEVYGKGRTVRRQVIHLLPRVVVVLDEATLPTSERIRLRWHTSSPARADAQGRFTVTQRGVTLAGSINNLVGKTKIIVDRHEYLPPYDKGRLGNPYPQRHEPFIETQARSDRFRTLSLFCVTGLEETVEAWQQEDGGWRIQTPEGIVEVVLNEGELIARRADGSQLSLSDHNK